MQDPASQARLSAYMIGTHCCKTSTRRLEEAILAHTFLNTVSLCHMTTYNSL